MKKYRFLVMLLALAGLAVSCSQNDPVERLNGENDRVILNTGIDAGLQTRASGDLQLTGYLLRYILEVWDENDVVAYREEKLVTNAAQAVDFEFSLPDEGDYDALLWADYVSSGVVADGEGHYPDLHYITTDVTGLKSVRIIPADYYVNTTSRDAFFGKASFTKGTTQADIGTVTLKRPFGRINIIEKHTATAAKLQSLALFYNVPTSFNVLDGTVSDIYSVSVTTTSFPVAATEKANLFYDYIFAPESGQHLMSEIEINYSFDNGDTYWVFNIPANMPVERNKRTNISGNIMTDPTLAGLSVEIDDVWNDPDIEHNASRIATVGSYYYEGGVFSETYNSSLTCLGVVFEVDATGEHGKIISLDQSGNLAWYPLTGEVTGADSEDNGAENTAKVKEGFTWQNYLAFRWCIDKGDGWYIPAIGELETFKAVWDTDFDGFNAKLTAAGGTAMDSDGRYWSSTETGQNTAFHLLYSYARANSMKSNDHLVRAMMAF